MSFNQISISAIVLAAGKGTRMHSDLPKVMHTVCGVSLIERTIRALLPLNLNEIVVVIGYQADLVKKEIEKIGERLNVTDKIKIVVQKEQLGTGHATQVAFSELNKDNKTALIIPGDVPLIDAELLSDFVEQFSKAKSTVSCLTTNIDNPFGYGRIVRDSDANVVAIVEEKDCSDQQKSISEINSSIYIANTDFLETSLGKLSPQNAQKEYYLTDIVALASQQNLKVSAMCCNDPIKVSGANNRLELQRLEQHRRTQLNNNLMLSGVTLADPATAYIDEDVIIEPDSTIGAAVTISGKSSIASGSIVQSNTHIRNSTIGHGSVIKSFSYLDNATVGNNCQIGPSAHLRPATHLEDDVKIGNFVETKNSQLKQGAKANHLSYLGDATVGEGANVGAGTITCNYDGKTKSKTVIEAGAFIGSNSALVAPVTIGNGAFVGAGSTITKDVPKNALAIARAKQVNLEDRAKKKN